MFLDDVDARCDENERIDGRAANADIVSFRSFFFSSSVAFYDAFMF